MYRPTRSQPITPTNEPMIAGRRALISMTAGVSPSPGFRHNLPGGTSLLEPWSIVDALGGRGTLVLELVRRSPEGRPVETQTGEDDKCRGSQPHHHWSDRHRVGGGVEREPHGDRRDADEHGDQVRDA